jgi:hypothetical protein
MQKASFTFGLIAIQLVAPIILPSLSTTSTCLAAEKHKGVEQSLVIKAPVKMVFEGIQSSRTSNPEKRRLVSQHQDTSVIDEKISDLPVIGTAHLVYKEIEVPFKRIDYLLVSSDKLKAFEGSWELTPLENGDTRVSLKSYTEVKVWVPFARELSSSSTIKDINRRLGNLKHWCEDQSCREAHQHDSVEPVNATRHNQTRLADNSGHSKVHADAEEALRKELKLDKE